MIFRKIWPNALKYLRLISPKTLDASGGNMNVAMRTTSQAKSPKKLPETNFQKQGFPENLQKFSTSSSSPANSNLSSSPCRQNYCEKCEALVNGLIQLELTAMYTYLAMAYFYGRDDVGFPGLHEYFKKAADDEKSHAEAFMTYQISRGGRVMLHSIAKPSKHEWISPLEAMIDAMNLEKQVNKAILTLHKTASDKDDPHLCDFLEGNYLDEQVSAIKELSEYVTQLRRCEPGLGEYLFDKYLQGSKS